MTCPHQITWTLVCLLLTFLNSVTFHPKPPQDSPLCPPTITMSTLDDDVSSAPCGICDRPVTWDDRGVECESCGTWFHASCQLIGSQTYQSLATEDISWRCVICANANYSSTLLICMVLNKKKETTPPYTLSLKQPKTLTQSTLQPPLETATMEKKRTDPFAS